MSDPVTVTLSQPVPDIDLNPMATITLTPPTGRHLIRSGNVLKIVTNPLTGEVGGDINMDAMGKLIGACANIPDNSVNALSAPDFMAISMWLTGFLAPSPIFSTPTATSAGSGAT